MSKKNLGFESILASAVQPSVQARGCDELPDPEPCDCYDCDINCEECDT